MLKLVLIATCLVGLPKFAKCDELSCPKKPGMYASSSKGWLEIPREAIPVNSYTPGFFLPNVTKELAGERAFVDLANPVKVCVSGSESTSTFSLEKAKVKKGTRQIVQSGNFHADKQNQSQSLASITDEAGNIQLMMNELKPGQYVIVMHGFFKEPVSTQADADPTARAMANAMASVHAITAGTQGYLFAFGIK